MDLDDAHNAIQYFTKSMPIMLTLSRWVCQRNNNPGARHAPKTPCLTIQRSHKLDSMVRILCRPSNSKTSCVC